MGVKDATELAKKKGVGKVFERMGTACRRLRGERVHGGWERKKGFSVMEHGGSGGEEPQEAGSGARTFS